MQPHQTITLNGVETLIVKAKDGDLQAQDTLMRIYFQGLYKNLLTPEKIDFLSWKTQNLKVENNYYQNDFYAYFVICHFEKLEAHLDFPKLFKITKKRADRKNADAQNNLGIMYAYGRGIKKDEKKACLHFKLAADQGHADAHNNLGVMYRSKEIERGFSAVMLSAPPSSYCCSDPLRKPRCMKKMLNST